MDSEKEKEPKNINGLRSEFSMGALDFERFDMLLKLIDNCGYNIRGKSPGNHVKPYYSALMQFYINIRPLMSKEKKGKFDKKFSEIKKTIYNNSQEGYKKDIPDKLEEINLELIDERQSLGLGIVASIKKRASQRMVLGMK